MLEEGNRTKVRTKELLNEGMKIESASHVGRVDKILSRILGFDVDEFTGRKSDEQNLSWSRSQIDRLVSAGGIKINGEPVLKGSQNLKVEDIVKIDEEVFREVSESLKKSVAAREFTHTGDKSIVKPEDIPLDVVYEDEDVLVVDKPAGMVVHPAYAHPDGTLANAVAGYLERNGKDVPQRVGLVHRLDKDVSGLMLIAKNDRALTLLSKQFSSEGIAPGMINNIEDVERILPHKARKHYWAVVCADDLKTLKDAGLIKQRFSKIEGYIRRCRGSGSRRKKFEFRRGLEGFEEDDARYCLSFMKVVKKVSEGKYLLEVQIVTGRTHQIRAQLSGLGFPVCGDEKYGGGGDGDRDGEVDGKRVGGIRLRSVKIEYIPPRVYNGCKEAAGRGLSGRSDRKRGLERSNVGLGSVSGGHLGGVLNGIRRKTVEKFTIP